MSNDTGNYKRELTKLESETLHLCLRHMQPYLEHLATIFLADIKCPDDIYDMPNEVVKGINGMLDSFTSLKEFENKYYPDESSCEDSD